MHSCIQQCNVSTRPKVLCRVLGMLNTLDMVTALAWDADTTHLIISLRLNKGYKGRSVGCWESLSQWTLSQPGGWERFPWEVCISKHWALLTEDSTDRSLHETEVDFSPERSLEAGGSEVREVRGLPIVPQRLDLGSTILHPWPQPPTPP